MSNFCLCLWLIHYDIKVSRCRTAHGSSTSFCLDSVIRWLHEEIEIALGDRLLFLSKRFSLGRDSALWEAKFCKFGIWNKRKAQGVLPGVFSWHGSEVLGRVQYHMNTCSVVFYPEIKSCGKRCLCSCWNSQPALESCHSGFVRIFVMSKLF